MEDFQIDSEKSDSSGKSGGIGATIFLILFATPFAGFGLLALVQGVRKWTAGNTHDGPMLCLFGLIFSLVGFGLMFGSILARKKSKQTAELQARFADRPWMMRADWAAGKIKSSSTVPVWFFLLWSFLAFALSAPGVWQIPKELKNGNDAILIVLIFPLVAFGLLGYTFKLWRSHRRFGDCFFELAQIPVPLGGVLEGMIQTGKPLKLEHELNMKISCVRRVVSGSGKSRQVNEHTLWQDEKIYSSQANLPEPEPGHTGIPVHFKLADGQPQCFTRDNVSVFWRLDARSKMRGPNFRAVFDLPVFKVAGAEISDSSATEADDSDPTATLQAPIDEIRREANSKIKISDGTNGREFYFPPAQNVGAALLVTIAAFVCIGIVVFLFQFHAPVIFPIVFGLVSILTIYGAFSAWFKSSRVTIDSTTVRVTTRWLIFSRAREFSASNVARFATKVGLQSGSQIFTDILIVRRSDEESFTARDEKLQDIFQDAESSGSKKVVARFQQVAARAGVTAASSIASAAEADWLVAEMNKALGRK
jgi:hypothetical protein